MAGGKTPIKKNASFKNQSVRDAASRQSSKKKLGSIKGSVTARSRMTDRSGTNSVMKSKILDRAGKIDNVRTKAERDMIERGMKIADKN